MTEEKKPASEGMKKSEDPADLRRWLESLLTTCVESGASDLHLVPGAKPTLRIQGVLELPDSREAVAGARIEQLAKELLKDVDRSPLDSRGAQDGALSLAEGARFRFNIYRRQGEISIAFRRLEDRFRPLSELGLPESLYRLCDLTYGLVVFAGPTGSGKSTTLATLIDRINERHRCHIITIEDPIEYLHRPLKSLINQRQIGTDASGFNDALIASLRQDPDVILVGEIRDLPTIRTAITAAETGHLVFTTVHAGDCVGAIERLVSVFPSGEQDGIRRQLALVLRAIVTQHLLVADGKKEQRPEGVQQGSVESGRGRVPVSEILLINPAVANLIVTGKSAQIYSAMESGGNRGMQTLEQDLARLWMKGAISETTALAKARSPKVLRDRAALMRSRVQGGFMEAEGS